MQLIFLSIIILSIIAIATILAINYKAITKGEIEIVEDNRNIKLYFQYTMAFYKYFIRRVNRTFKFVTQYALHLVVRFLYIINILTDKIYAWSRNLFVKNATKNKSTITHFWNHLKVYKREIDEEKE